MHRLFVGGWWYFRCVDASGREVWRERAKNGVTWAGVDYLLAGGFNGGSKFNPWYGGLIAGSSAVTAITDTAAVHPGWSEFVNTVVFRPQWVPAAPNSGILPTAAAFQWQGGVSGYVQGAFLISSKSLAPGPVLYCTCVMATARQLIFGQTIMANYILRIRE